MGGPRGKETALEKMPPMAMPRPATAILREVGEGHCA